MVAHCPSYARRACTFTAGPTHLPPPSPSPTFASMSFSWGAPATRASAAACIHASRHLASGVISEGRHLASGWVPPVGVHSSGCLMTTQAPRIHENWLLTLHTLTLVSCPRGSPGGAGTGRGGAGDTAGGAPRAGHPGAPTAWSRALSSCCLAASPWPRQVVRSRVSEKPAMSCGGWCQCTRRGG
jgi:hypothetical protein